MKDKKSKDGGEFVKRENGFVKSDGGKPRMSLLPWDALEPVARILTLGAEKYDDDNWRRCDDPQVYVDALLRHLSAAQQGIDLDVESGEVHWAHVACCALFLTSLETERIEREEKMAKELQEKLYRAMTRIFDYGPGDIYDDF